MSIKEIKSNHELLNAYNRYTEALNEYKALPDILEKRKKEELGKIKQDVLMAIDTLFSFSSFKEIANSDEVKEIEKVKAEIESLSV